jgi:hypothetical protein
MNLNVLTPRTPSKQWYHCARFQEVISSALSHVNECCSDIILQECGIAVQCLSDIGQVKVQGLDDKLCNLRVIMIPCLLLMSWPVEVDIDSSVSKRRPFDQRSR